VRIVKYELAILLTRDTRKRH